MNVRWIKWSELLTEAALLRNLDHTLDPVPVSEARRIAQAVNMATDFAWKFHPWDAACWVMNDLEASGLPIPLLEPGYAILRSYSEDPLAAWEAEEQARVVGVKEVSGTYRYSEAATTPFYLVRTAAPRFGGEARDGSTSYRAGDLVYDSTTGECWRAVRDMSPTALPTWYEWTAGASQLAAQTHHVRRAGVLWDCSTNHTAATTNEPAYGTDWLTYWTAYPAVWTPMRLPHFLLPAVLAGARQWMESASTGAMQDAMVPALETEVSDFTLTRAQRFAPGHSSTIL